MSAGGAAWLAEARLEYARTLPDNLARLERRLSALMVAPADGAAFDALLGAVHRLHGSAGSFGFAALGRLAGEWELHLLALRDAGDRTAPEALESMWARLTTIRHAEGPEPSTGPASSAPTQTPPRDASPR